MQNFQDTSETRKESFTSVFSICMTAPLIFQIKDFKFTSKFNVSKKLNDQIFNHFSNAQRNTRYESLLLEGIFSGLIPTFSRNDLRLRFTGESFIWIPSKVAHINHFHINSFLVESRMLNLHRIDISNSSIFIGNNFQYVINCLNIKRITICRGKSFGIVTLKILPKTCFRYNSEEKGTKLLIWRVKLKWINTSFTVQIQRISTKWQVLKNLLVYLSRKVYAFI